MINIHHLSNSSSCHSTHSTHRQFYLASEYNDPFQLGQSLMMTVMILMMTMMIKTLIMNNDYWIYWCLVSIVDRIQSKRGTHSCKDAHNIHWTQRGGGGEKSAFLHYSLSPSSGLVPSLASANHHCRDCSGCSCWKEPFKDEQMLSLLPTAGGQQTA